MENNVDINEEQNQPTQQDWFKASMIFAKTLGYMFNEDEGVVIDLNDLTKIEGQKDVNKVIVFKQANQVHIAPCEEDIAEGTFLKLGIDPNEDIEMNTEVVD